MRHVCNSADWLYAPAVQTKLPRRASGQGKRPCAISGIVLAWLPAVLYAQVADPSSAEGTIRGMVKSGNMPIPGVTVTATNRSTKDKMTTWTNVDGTYRLRVHSFGLFVITTQMVAFAPVKQEVTLDANARDAAINLELILESRVRHSTTSSGRPQTAATRRPSTATQVTFGVLGKLCERLPSDGFIERATKPVSRFRIRLLPRFSPVATMPFATDTKLGPYQAAVGWSAIGKLTSA
jgi:hypothetical protein